MAPSGKWIDGLGPDSRVEEAARRSLEARLSAVNECLPLAAYLAEQDIEHVHRLRVTTRRAVAAIQLFRDWLPRKRARRLEKQLKKIRRAAGAARDFDVLSERLPRDYGEHRAAPVLALLAEDRVGVQPALVKIADRCRRRDRFVRRVAKLLQRINPPAGQTPCATRFCDWAAERLSTAADDFFAMLPDDQADLAALHPFRIRAKALRYTIELVAPAFGPELRSDVYPAVEELQQRLGKIQDYVTAVDHLCKLADKARDAALQQSLRGLADEESSRLADELHEYCDWWTPGRADSLRRQLTAEGRGTPTSQAAGQT